MNEITLKLTLDEVNVVLSALGTLPYNQVAQLVLGLRIQAQEQIERAKAAQAQPAEDLAESDPY